MAFGEWLLYFVLFVSCACLVIVVVVVVVCCLFCFRFAFSPCLFIVGFCFVGWLVGWLVGLLVGGWVGGWLVGWLICDVFIRLLGWLLVCFVCLSFSLL